MMEAVMVKSLLAPFRKFTSCVTNTAEGFLGSKFKLDGPQPTGPRERVCGHERESRKLYEARHMEKNAERAAMRAHFRRKYQLPTNAEDSRRVRAAVGKVVIPHHLTKMAQSKVPDKERSGLLSVFQNLSFSTDFTYSAKRSATHRG